jgi:hypothetical protein
LRVGLIQGDQSDGSVLVPPVAAPLGFHVSAGQPRMIPLALQEKIALTQTEEKCL